MFNVVWDNDLVMHSTNQPCMPHTLVRNQILGLISHLNSTSGVWEKHFDWIVSNFLCWTLLLYVLTSIQLGNKWSVAYLGKRDSPFDSLHCLLLFFNLLFCYCHNSKHHLPLPPCPKPTQVIIEGLFGRLWWQNVGFVGWSPLWVWEWSPIYGGSSCRICSSRCCSG